MRTILNSVVACAFLLSSLAVFTGCMLMMPAMMAPGMARTSPSEDKEYEKLVKEAVSELAVNRGGYNVIELGRIETDGRALSEKKLREMIVNQIAASGKLVLSDRGQKQTAAAGITGEDRPVRAILAAELRRLESRDRLDLKLKDARSGLIVWEKRSYSSPPSSASSHAH
jgi:hypothetical protein